MRFGVPGMDEVLCGGIPPNSLVLVEGSPGSGKTTLGLQFLQQGVREGEASLLVSNSETPAQLRAIADSHGWSLEGIHILEWGGRGDAEQEYTLFPESEVEAGQVLEQLFDSLAQVRPARLVIDTVSVLRALAPSPFYYRRQLRRVRQALSSQPCTTLVLDDATPGDKDLNSRTLADGLIELDAMDFRYGNDRRRLRVRKLRGAPYVSGAHDFKLQTGGMTVYPRLIAVEHELTGAPDLAASGIDALDRLAGGGLPRGSTTLTVGPAGSGKSTLCMAYMHAAAARGERCAAYLFDESATSFLERGRGLGLDLRPAVEAGRLSVESLDPAELTPGEIAHRVVAQVEQGGVRMVAIDTVNGYLQSAAEEPLVMLHLRELLSFLARRGVVTLLTLTQHGLLDAVSSAPLDVSYVADNVFLLRFIEAAGAVHKSLSMVKKRTGPHETTVRELRLGAQGIELGEPLVDLVRVLDGKPRYGARDRSP